jgi:hypothetical protein
MASDRLRRRVFISWSKPRSKHVAIALRAWLPNVLQVLDPWMSDRDLDAGSRWTTEVGRQLDDADFGIVCVTPENQAEPWLQFEAGALGKALDTSRVCPYLFDLAPAELEFPLAMFQAAVADKVGTKHLVSTINRSLELNALGERQLDETFELWWPNLADKMAEGPTVEDVPEPKSEKQLLQELVSLVRYLVADRNPEERAAEMLGLFKGLFQGLGAPPLPPTFDEAIRTSMVEAMKPGTERTKNVLRELLREG